LAAILNSIIGWTFGKNSDISLLDYVKGPFSGLPAIDKILGPIMIPKFKCSTEGSPEYFVCCRSLFKNFHVACLLWTWDAW